MERTGCYDSVVEVVDAASEQFGDAHPLNIDRFAMLEDICSSVDKVVDEIECSQIDVSVGAVNRVLTISFVCDDLELQHGREHEFFSLIQMLDSFSFSKATNDGLWVALNVDGLWEVEDE